ncbi:transposase [uncultured Thiodictyon sp.]|uniref:transposase n=1 Tax=uncultured Thiodictyon sp. TaxID=1846217 RepID=UPI0025FB4B0C|nr:transposase [uncultured Thiodictyon sp.]
MARHARIVVANYPLHVIARGIDRAAIFFSESDRQYFLGSLGELAAAEAVMVHAYALMTNHFHILITPTTEPAAARLMKGLGFRYVQYVNRSYGRTGTLFEGRFRSSIIEGDRYLLACQRYIELNPVRAGLVADPGAYPSSSYRANALGVPDTLLTPHPLYASLGETDEARRAPYRDLIATAIAQDVLREIRTATNGGFALGSERFQREIAAMLGRRTWRSRPGRPRVPERYAGQMELPI